jgi:hypothetical protein
MGDKVSQKPVAVGGPTGRGASSSPIWKPSEPWENASIPIDLLHRIAIVVGAQNPMALQKRTFPTHPMDIVLFLVAVVGEDYKQKLKYDRSARKQIRQIKRVGQIAIELENAINHLEEPARLRLQNAYGSLKAPIDEISKLVEATRSAAQPQKKKDSHRPLHTFKHGALNFLVEGLYFDIVVGAKGKLTLWQDSATGKLKGTLPEVLELLRPHLPGILPEKMHFSTLHRALARAKKPLIVMPIQKAAF